MTCTREARTLIAALALLAAAPAGAGADPAAPLLDRAETALAARDGIAAEARLRDAIAAGASRDAVRAAMGEALLAQGELATARGWLAPARFTPATRARGWRMLGRLAQRDGDHAAARRALDRALAAAPDDPRAWTDLGRLRLATGDRRGAIEAAEQALRLAPREAEALALRAVLVRSQFGAAASLPWFEAALRQAPGDPDLLADHAATLGDMGRAQASLAAARRLHDAAPGDPRGFYLQAVLAARAGRHPLARRLLGRVEGRMREVPGVLLLGGVLELEAGNVNLAVARLDRLLRLQPDNPHAQALLARALLRSGEPDQVVARFDREAQRADASPYLATLVARAHDRLGHRDLAGALLARAAAPRAPAMMALPVREPLPALARRWAGDPARADVAVPYIRALLGAGRGGEAAQAAARLRDANPGAPDAHLLAGDVALHRGRTAEALAAYRAAAAIRFGEAEALRLDAALRAMGRPREAELVLYVHAVQNPGSLRPARLLANAQARGGRWAASARLLAWIGARSGWRDPQLLADLALARLQSGQRGEARRLAAQALALQPGNAAARAVRRLSAAPTRVAAAHK